MNREAVYDFLNAIGAEDVYDNGGEWIRAACPLAPWHHEDGINKSRAFGIKVNDEGSSGYYCFSCESGGRLPRLVFAIWMNSGEYPVEAAAVIWDEEIFDEAIELRIVKRHPKQLVAKSPVVPMPVDAIEKYPRLIRSKEATEYLVIERKISLQSIADYKLRVFKDDGGRLGIIFPIMSKEGVVLDAYVRLVGEKKFFRLNAKITGATEDYKASHLMFGNQFIDRNRPLWIVEAPLDALRLHTLGVRNVVATCGPPRDDQIKNIYAPVGVVLAFDADKAGRKFTQKMKEQLSTPVIHTIDWEVVGVKDGNEVGSLDEVKEALSRRKTYKSPF